MIRLVTALFLSIVPLMAHAASKDDYTRVLQIFYGSDKYDSGNYIGSYTDRVVANLAGRWAILIGLNADAFSDDAVRNYCTNATTISDVTRYGFTTTFGRPGHPQLHSKFRLFNGNTFVQYSDPMEVLTFFGMNTDGLSDQLKVGALNSTSGFTTVTRYSDDILVLQRNYGAPDIFVRCKQ